MSSRVLAMVAGTATLGVIIVGLYHLLQVNETEKKKKSSKIIENKDELKTKSTAMSEKVSKLLNGDMKSTLAKRLLEDPEFQLPTEGGKLQNGIQEIMKKAMWDVLRDDIEKGNIGKLKALIMELKGRLINLTPNRKDLIEQLNQVLDVGLLSQQLENSSFNEWDILPMCKFVISWIRNLESPGRNTETDTWMKSFIENTPKQDRITSLRCFFDFAHRKIDLIELDTANVYLRQISPVVQSEGIEYLQQKFQERLNEGNISLEKTIEWCKNLEQPSDTTKFQKYSKGFLEFVLCGGKYKLEGVDIFERKLPYPIIETMEDQQNKIFEFIKLSQLLWRLAYVLLRTRQIVPTIQKHHVDQVVRILESDMERILVETSGDGKKTEVTKLSFETYKNNLVKLIIDVLPIEREDDKVLLSSLIMKTFTSSIADDDTFNIISKHLQNIISNIVLCNNTVQRQQLAENIVTNLKPLQLTTLAPQVFQFAKAIIEFAERDYRIHETVYSKYI